MRFDDLDARQSLFDVRRDEYGSAFPLAAYAAWLDDMLDRGVVFLTYQDLFADCRDRDWESGYRNEYIKWKKRCDSDRVYILLQHDVDFAPDFTRRMVALEADRGIRSNIFLFNELAGGYPTDSPYDDTPYKLDTEFLQGAEAAGWTIGYHQNVVPRCNGTMASASHLFESDVHELRTMFQIEYFCPHGGRGAELDGKFRNNYDIEVPDSLSGTLRWVYNRYGLRYSGRWSDGGIRRVDDVEKLDALDLLGNFSQGLQRGHRYFVLTHPQLWGWNVQLEYNPALAARPWHRELMVRWDRADMIPSRKD